MGNTIGALLKDRRRQLRMTQFDLAELAGISANTLIETCLFYLLVALAPLVPFK